MAVAVAAAAADFPTGRETESLMTQGPTRVERPSAGESLERGAICGEYIVESQLGRGGFGRVYLARHRVLGRGVAIKVLDRELAASPRAYQRFVWEARTACRVRHPNVIEILDFGRLTDGRPFLVMELLDGETLEERLAARGRLGLAETVAIVDALAAALSAVHRAGVVHRDVKPSNVFLRTPDDRVTLLDFGIAKLVRPEPEDRPLVTTVNTRLGTPEAMAPEQILGLPIDGRTDVYGLGITLYRMLTGAWPFAADDDAELERLHLEATPAPPSERAPVPPAIDEVIARALAKDPAARPSDATMIAAELREAAGRVALSAPIDRHDGEAVACFFEVRAQGTDRGGVDRIAHVLDLAGEVIAAAGWSVTAQTATSVLTAATRPPRTLSDAAALAEELLSRTRGAVDDTFVVHASVHADRAVIEGGAEGRIVGGPITLRAGASA